MLKLRLNQEILKKQKKKFSQDKKLSITDSFQLLENLDLIFLANSSQSMRSS